MIFCYFVFFGFINNVPKYLYRFFFLRKYIHIYLGYNFVVFDSSLDLLKFIEKSIKFNLSIQRVNNF